MPLALPPLYRKAELEMNFPSSAAGRVDGTGDEEAGRPPTSTSAQMDELQETSRALNPVNRSTFAQRDATELEMTLMNGSDSGVATNATNQPQVTRHQSNKARRYMYIVGVGVLVLIGLCLVTNAYLLIRLDQTEGELHAVETKLQHYACPEGWGGDDCGDEIPYCDWHENPCLHSGACQSKDRDNFSCKCTNGYTGETCDDKSLPCCKSAIRAYSDACLGYHAVRCRTLLLSL